MKIAAIQMSSSAVFEENILQAEKYLAVAGSSECKLVLLPENVLCHGTNDQIRKIAQTESEWLDILSRYSIENSLNVVWGGIPVKSDDKLFNMSLVINQTGSLVAKYAKNHLFECKGISSEKELYNAGSKKTEFILEGWKIAMSICFDIRFPDHFRQPDLILCSAAFSEHTGRDHWELLCRARAVENQSYLVAANQCTISENPFPTFGHSMIVDPWGEVLRQIGTGPGIIISELDKKRILQVRTDMPLHMRSQCGYPEF